MVRKSMTFFDTELTLLVLGVILFTTVLARTLSSRFGFPALFGAGRGSSPV